MKYIWSFLQSVIHGILVIFLVVGLTVIFFLQLLRRHDDFTYTFTLLSLVAISTLLLLIGYAAFANGMSRKGLLEEFRKLDLKDRVQTVTSVATAAVVIVGVLFAAVSFDQGRFTNRLAKVAKTDRVRQDLRDARAFGSSATRQVRASLGTDFDLSAMDAAPVLDYLMQHPAARQFLGAIEAGEDCIESQSCQVSLVRKSICDATELLAEWMYVLPGDRFDGDDASAWFREIAEQSSAAVFDHCPLPQAIEHLWLFHLNRGL